MQSVLEFLVQFLLAFTGAVGLAIAWVGALALACLGGFAGCGWYVMGRRRKGRKRKGD
ncbi:hypothetical protein GCM10023208_17980 [Erythrobacter westpacificensis]|uniref:LPXTG cell wall anchor domain-containing protein n=1 Tax=Erythrobacter westpacificensis TaxID=1055231 RepID=A0ABP9KCQ8_9SPHN